MLRPLSVAIGSVMLAACGSEKPVEDNVDYSQLKATPQSENALILADEGALKQHLANGLRLQLSSNSTYRGNGLVFGVPEAAPNSGSDGAGGDGAPSPSPRVDSGFSQTNVHVSGVDEADYVKYDGRHWFIATQPAYEPYSIEEPTSGIKIVDLDPSTPNAEVVSEFDMEDDQWGGANELYLVGDEDSTSHVAVLRSQWGNVWPILPGFPMDIARGFDGGIAVSMPTPSVGIDSSEAAERLIYPGPRNGSVRVDLLDVADTSAPAKDWSIEIDGSLIQTRKIGNVLYLVTRFDPWLDGIQYENQDLSIREENEQAISAAELGDLIPHYRSGDTETPLSTRCFVQSDMQDHYGLSSLVHITAVDLSSKKMISSQCVNSNVENLSMSPQSLYLTGTVGAANSDSPSTVIHKFALDEAGPAYVDSGKVIGSLGWNSDPVFRMHEHEDQFRIVTSSNNWSDPEHYLTIFQEIDGTLAKISELPNNNHPEPIGKPGEDIYSVRFEENWAYIVTFQRTDPLYAIDLSDPTNPIVAGELEVPGFATYMHPVGGDYLFTFGQNADENGRVQGLKAELISVANGTPEVVTTLHFGDAGSYSPALNDLRALSFLPIGEDSMRIAIPMTVYQSTTDREGAFYTGTQLLLIDGITGSAVMQDAGVVIVSDTNNGNSVSNASRSRTVLHNDAVFVNFNNDVWFTNWLTPKEVKGPIPGELVYCTAEVRMGLAVTLNLEGATDEQNQTACDARVIAIADNYSEQLEPVPSDDAEQCVFQGAAERPGHYLIEASLEGFYGVDAKTTVYHDECHVITEEVEMTLPAIDGTEPPTFCDLRAVPSLDVRLSAVDGNFDICDANVYAEQDGELYPLELWQHQGARDSASSGSAESDAASLIVADPMPAPACFFQGPWELPGEMTLHVEHPDYASFTQDVVVEADECHVQTVPLDVMLQVR